MMKAEVDIKDSNIAHCYLYSQKFGGMDIISIVTFSLSTCELLCYQEYSPLAKSLVTYIEKSNCVNKISKHTTWRQFSPGAYGFVYPAERNIIRLPIDSVPTTGFSHTDYPIVFYCPAGEHGAPKYTCWSFIGIDLSPNERFLACDFLGETKICYWGGSGNYADIYECDLEKKEGVKIIEGGTNSRFSANSNFLIFKKIKQTWGITNYHNMGYYIYNRSTKETTFYKQCDAACFVRLAKDYISYGRQIY